MTPDQTRQAFEAWYAASGRDPAWLTKRADGTYTAPICQAPWEAFQAALSLRLVVDDQMVERGARAVAESQCSGWDCCITQWRELSRAVLSAVINGGKQDG